MTSTVQVLGDVAEAQNALSAFQTFVGVKDWGHAADTIASATAAHHRIAAAAAGAQSTCLRGIEDTIASCSEQLQIELVHAAKDAAWLSSLDEVSDLCASKLKV